MAGIIDRLRLHLRLQSPLMKIIYLNAAVWVALRLAAIVGLFAGVNLTDAVLSLVEMPSDLAALGRRPWTVLTYMFSQWDVMGILFNMLWLYWFGIIFQGMVRADRLAPLYVAGGLGGAALYLAAYNFMPGFAGQHGVLLGSSAAVIAIVTATAIIVPNYKMHLLFLGAVSLKWVAIVTIGLDILSVSGNGLNAGGHIAHLGGAVVGAVYGLQMRHRFDMLAPVAGLLSRARRAFSGLFGARRRFKKAPATPPKASAADRAELDAILDKIKRSGYASLTPEERRKLFDVSNRIK